ncbi:hypothetical protein Tco_0349124, partial [Tanacetum coccineum]
DYNGREMWPVVEATTVIVPPLYKPQVGRPPKKRKKSHDEIANESCSSGNLSRKGKSVRCGMSLVKVVQEELLVQGVSLVRQVQDKLLVQGLSLVKYASSQPSAAPRIASQGLTKHSAGPRQGFQAPRPGFPTQILTKAIASRHNPRKLSS